MSLGIDSRKKKTIDTPRVSMKRQLFFVCCLFFRVEESLLAFNNQTQRRRRCLNLNIHKCAKLGRALAFAWNRIRAVTGRVVSSCHAPGEAVVHYHVAQCVEMHFTVATRQSLVMWPGANANVHNIQCQKVCDKNWKLRSTCICICVCVFVFVDTMLLHLMMGGMWGGDKGINRE